MTFTDQVWIEVIRAFSTTMLVAIVGTVVAEGWSKRRERRREQFEIRTGLLNDVARIGQGMYVTLQHTRRRVIQATKEADKAAALNDLDQAFLQFSIDAAGLQTLIGAHFGVVRTAPEDVKNLPAFLRWHQVHDLLALYYYNLKEFFPGIVLSETERGHGGNYHSGLNLDSYREANLDADVLRKMRRDIRTVYDEAMIDLARAITGSEMKKP